VKAAEVMPGWAPHFSVFDTVVGYSALGHVFMRNSETNEYIVLHPYQKGAKNYGVFADLQTFEKQLLQEPGFAGFVLQDFKVKKIRELQGLLGENEVYVATPYPFLGGDGSPESYKKGDVWVFLDLVAQMWGLDG
jgi:hypothetical protein